jgi:hypothetical protein
MTLRQLVVTLAASLLSFVGIGHSQPSANEAAPRDDRHALLVGVTFYENLPKAKHLAGPGNDVVLMRKLLVEKLQFRPEQIVVLSEQQGQERGNDYLPTKANIAREFKRLALVAKPGDHVVIHLGGHGSQQPEDKSAPDPEPDGLDEIFLPRDVGAWDGKKGTIANAIIDDEVGTWLKAIRDKRASVWINFDSCHSGTMIRGGDDSEKARDLDPVDDLGIPKTAIKEAVDFAAKREANHPERSRGGYPPPAFKLAKEGGIVAIYACQPNEVTYERELPPRNKEAKVYGLLTYSICKILTEATEKSSEPITYNELARRIHGQYMEWGRMTPTPLIEGIDRDRQVLGDKVWPGRSSIILGESDEGYTINAGALHGMTAGSVLAVQPPPGQGKMLLGHVRIKELGAYSSVVEPCAYEKSSLTKVLPVGGACKTVFVDVGDQQLRVAVDPRDAEGQKVAELRFAELKRVVKGLSGPPSLILPVDDAKQADWLVRFDREKAVLVPASGWKADRRPDDAQLGPAPIDPALGDWLKDGLNRIARAESLKRLAAGGQGAGDGNKIRLELKITLKKDKLDRLGSIPTDWPTTKLTAQDQDRFVIKMLNKGRVPVDVTALYIDSGYGIGCLFPSEDMDVNRLLPGESPSFSLKINSKTTGMEQLVIIAVKAKGPTVDFTQLQQPSLERAVAGTRGEDLNHSLETPLGRLLKRGMYGIGGSRAASTEELDEHLMTVVSFDVRPKTRP